MSERKTPEVAHCVERLLPESHVAQERRKEEREGEASAEGDGKVVLLLEKRFFAGARAA